MNAREELGLSKDASLPEVKSAWGKIASKHHPDHGGSVEDFRRVFEIYKRAVSESSICPECQGTKRKVVNRGLFSMQFPCKKCTS